MQLTAQKKLLVFLNFYKYDKHKYNQRCVPCAQGYEITVHSYALTQPTWELDDKLALTT